MAASMGSFSAVTVVILYTWENHRKTMRTPQENVDLPSGNLTYRLNMTIEIVDLPIANGDFPQLCLIARGYHTRPFGKHNYGTSLFFMGTS